MSQASARDKAIRLFKYLRQISDLRSKPVLHHRQFERTVWLSDIFEAHEFPTDEHSDGWFSVKRVALPKRPPTPVALSGSVDEWELDDWRSSPTLQLPSQALPGFLASTGGESQPGVVAPSEDLETARAWDSFLPVWESWQSDCDALAPAHAAYQSMFAAHQRSEQLGEQFELVLNVGLLAWETAKGVVLRHLIAAPCTMHLDSGTGELIVGPDEDAAQPLLFEQGMVPPDQQPRTRDVGDLQLRAEEIGDVLDTPSIFALLKSWVLAADPDGAISEVWTRAKPGSTPEITYAPALCLRKRTQSGLQATYESILKQLEDPEQPVPASIMDLVSFTGARLGDEEGDENQWIPQSGNVFFPLASNEQQRNIIRTLGTKRGLVVQGPPGTGKSQTIANLICHSLAMGKRVLVTSHTERALRVLQEKLPSEFEQLTVNVVGSGRSGSKDIERSANALLGRMSDPRWDIHQIDRRIAATKARLDTLETGMADARSALSTIYAAQRESLNLGPDHVGLMSELIERLAAESGVIGWITDEIVGTPPISDEQFDWLQQWNSWAPTADQEELGWHVPDLDPLPTPDELAKTINMIESATARTGDETQTSLALTRVNAEEIAKLVELAQRVLGQESAARRRPGSWVLGVVTDIEHGRDEPWRLLEARTVEALGECAELGSFGDAAPLSHSLETLQRLDHQGAALVEHLEGGGSLRRFGRARAVKDAADFLELSVDGRDITSIDAASEMHRRIRISLELAQCVRQWNGAVPSEQPTIQHLVGALQHAHETLQLLISLHDMRLALGTALQLADPEILPGTADEVMADLLRHQAELRLLELRQDLATVATSIVAAAPDSSYHPSLHELLSCLRTEDATGYEAAYADLRRGVELARSVRQAAELQSELNRVVPNVGKTILSSTDQHRQPAQFARAWNWRLAKQGAERLSQGGMASHFDELTNLSAQIAASTTELGELQAWRSAMSTLTDAQASHLKAYQQALSRLGKGTGKRAASHRAEARRHLAECQSAIPAWIMPTYRVAETITANAGAFDVVIVDEASQSGIEALFLLWLGKQLIIVGDDKQISPSNVGVREADVERLQQEYLGDFELRDLLDISHSLFDQAKVRYSGDVWLTEHFRCMPEIIEFSNRHIYAPQHRRLDPLRQFGSDRLAPLRSTFVAEAVEEADVNRAEAEALVRQVVACNDDPAYDGKSFGVITLLGTRQAALIEAQLFERLGESWTERELRCGNAYDFQGDERDIIFVSMVKAVGPSQRTIRKLGAAGDLQRYNVAASRAKDQMWLFHSMRLEDLNPECIRSALLRHFTEPPALDVVGFTEDVERDTRHMSFDSLFEQRVFLDIREMGYVIEPQVEVYGKRIDLVVAGSAGKLAVECDGSAFHGPDEFAADVARQQELERVGWTFHRISDVDYYTDHQEALAGLVDHLTQLGIYPAGFVPEPAAEASSASTGAEIASDDSGANALSNGDMHVESSRQATPVGRDDDDFGAQETEQEPDNFVQTFDANLAPATNHLSETRNAPPPEPNFQAASADVTGPASHMQSVAQRVVRDPVESPTTYDEWDGVVLTDISTAPADYLAGVLISATHVEGPIQVNYLFQIVNKAAGNSRLGSQIRRALDGALAKAIELGALILESEESTLADGVVRAAEQPPVSLRFSGGRSLYEYPEFELAELIRFLHGRDPDGLADEENLFRAVIGEFGSRKLTKKATAFIKSCRSANGVSVVDELLATPTDHYKFFSAPGND